MGRPRGNSFRSLRQVRDKLPAVRARARPAPPRRCGRRRRLCTMPMQLVVHLVASKDAFVSLPPNVVDQIFAANDSTASMVFRLEWKDSDGAPRTACVSWMGGASTNGTQDLEIPMELGGCIGLGEGQQVRVKALKSVKRARTVNVTPLTEDDWEVVELYPSELEAQLLNQVQIVSVDTVIPIWTSNGVCLRVKVDSIEPTPSVKVACARLGNETEVIVAPRERKRVPEEGEGEAERIWPTQPLRVLPLAEEQAAGGPPEHCSVDAAVSPSTLHKYGWEAGMVCLLRPPSSSTERGCGTRQCDSEAKQASATDMDDDTDDALDQEDMSERSVTTGAFVRLVVDSSLPFGHVTVSAGLRQQLRIFLLTVARMKPLDTRKAPKAVPTQPLRLHRVQWGGEGAADDTPTDAEVLDAFGSWRRRAAAEPFPAVQGSLVRLEIGTDSSCFVVLKFDADKRLACEPMPAIEGDEPGEDELETGAAKVSTKPLGVKDVRWIDADTCPDTAKVTMGAGDPIELALIAEHHSDGPGMTQIAGVEEAKDDVVKFLRTSLHGAQQRAQLGMPPGGGMMICGASGTGKTALATAAAHNFRCGEASQHSSNGPPQAPAFFLAVDCASFVSAKAATVKSSWRKIYKEAQRNAPSVIVCDDLDQLVPSGGSEGGGGAARETNALGRFLAELFFPPKAQSRGAGPVVLMACCKSKSSMLPMLMIASRFDSSVSLALPDAKCRQAQLETLLEQSGVGHSEVNMTSLAAKTDSFAAADLKRLASRMAHHAAARELTQQAAEHGSSSHGRVELEKVEASEDDVEVAMEGLAPASLQGVKLTSVEGSAKTWDDVGGLSNVRKTLTEMFEMPAKYPELFNNSPIRLRSGVMLYGPSGCGKTMMASVIAKECGMHFISVKGPELLNKYIGASEQNVRQKFEEAKAARPCILFFDEMDSVAPRRGKDNTGVTDRVVNAFLTELDGVEERNGVYVLGATSRPDTIDPALLRPGRLDTMALCDFPTRDERVDILQKMSANLKLRRDVDFEEIADRTENYSPADLQAIINDAQLEAVHVVLEAEKDAMLEAGADAKAPEVRSNCMCCITW